MKADDYEARLSAWKKAHGFRDVSPEAEANELLKASDRTLDGEDYCVLCGKGPQKITDLVLITREDDPYIQPDFDDQGEVPIAERVRACPKCWNQKYVEGDDDFDD